MSAGFYAIAYATSGVAGFSVGEKTIAYRGSFQPDLMTQRVSMSHFLGAAGLACEVSTVSTALFIGSGVAPASSDGVLETVFSLGNLADA